MNPLQEQAAPIWLTGMAVICHPWPPTPAMLSNMRQMIHQLSTQPSAPKLSQQASKALQTHSREKLQTQNHKKLRKHANYSVTKYIIVFNDAYFQSSTNKTTNHTMMESLEIQFTISAIKHAFTCAIEKKKACDNHEIQRCKNHLTPEDSHASILCKTYSIKSINIHVNCRQGQ